MIRRRTVPRIPTSTARRLGHASTSAPLPPPHKASLRERLGHELVSRFPEQHELETRPGFAPNPDLAALAARTAADSAAAVRVFDGSPVSIRDQLASLPLDVIDPPSDYRGILLLWGIQTLGEFTALPRDEVAERLGPDAAELWDRAAGKRRRLLRLVRPPADFTPEIDLEVQIRTLEPLFFCSAGVWKPSPPGSPLPTSPPRKSA